MSVQGARARYADDVLVMVFSKNKKSRRRVMGD